MSLTYLITCTRALTLRELNKVVAQLSYLVIVKVMFLSKDFERNKFSS